MALDAAAQGFSWAIDRKHQFEDQRELQPGLLDGSSLARKGGSAPELVETRILGGFLKNDKFGLGDGHALGLEQ
jgi:hypothetical protein